jgi:dihydroneopterin aldolase
MPFLRVQSLELPIHLGWPDDERKATQLIRIDLEITFSTPPEACRTDQLSDSVDYGSLAEVLRATAAARPYRLLEHFAATALEAVRARVDRSIGLALVVTKYPAIEGLAGGVSFTVEDRADR